MRAGHPWCEYGRAAPPASLSSGVSRPPMIALLNKWLRKTELKDERKTSRHLRLWDQTLELVERSTVGPQYKDTTHWKARLRDLDPDQVRLESYSAGGPHVAIYTRFFREVVALRSWSSTCGYKQDSNRVHITFPVRKSLSKRELNALKEELGALQAGRPPASRSPGNLDVAHLRRRVKELKELIESLTNNLDFSAHAGAGVVEQDVSIGTDTLQLTLRQLRKHSPDSPGSRITSVVPLHFLTREIYLRVDHPNPNPGALGRGIPPARICSQCDHMRIRQHFVNPDKEFEHECYCEDIFVPTLEDVVLFGKALEELIAAARELQFHGS
jgi:hypothetical protein